MLFCFESGTLLVRQKRLLQTLLVWAYCSRYHAKLFVNTQLSYFSCGTRGSLIRLYDSFLVQMNLFRNTCWLLAKVILFITASRRIDMLCIKFKIRTLHGFTFKGSERSRVCQAYRFYLCLRFIYLNLELFRQCDIFFCFISKPRLSGDNDIYILHGHKHILIVTRHFSQ